MHCIGSFKLMHIKNQFFKTLYKLFVTIVIIECVYLFAVPLVVNEILKTDVVKNSRIPSNFSLLSLYKKLEVHIANLLQKRTGFPCCVRRWVATTWCFNLQQHQKLVLHQNPWIYRGFRGLQMPSVATLFLNPYFSSILSISSVVSSIVVISALFL